MLGEEGSLVNLEREPRKVVMFGGKGGVGKTTCAAATAIHFSSMGKKTLIISSDAMPSLSDIFEVNVGSKETRVRGAKNLYAVEIGSEEVIERWKKKFGPEVYEALSTVLPVEYEIINYVAGAPGIDEEFMLDYILELVEGERYDVVVWDTAPAGHTLRLLSLPNVFIEHLEAAARVYLSLQEYVKKLRETIGLRKSKRTPMDIISGWRKLAEKVVNFLRDKNKTEFIVVTIPEALGVFQTRRLIKEFNGYGIPVGHIIINNVIFEPDCKFHREKREMQQKYIKMIREEYMGRKDIIEVPLFPYEIKGIKKLVEVEEVLFKER